MNLPSAQPIASWGKYFGTFPVGVSQFRIVTPDLIGGYSVRDKTVEPNTIHRAKASNELQPIWDQKVKCFRLMWVIRRVQWGQDEFQLLELDKASIIKKLQSYFDNPNRWDLTKYDISVNKTWSWLTTKYDVTAIPPKPLTPEDEQLIINNPVNLENIWIEWASVFLDQDDVVTDEELWEAFDEEPPHAVATEETVEAPEAVEAPTPVEPKKTKAKAKKSEAPTPPQLPA